MISKEDVKKLADLARINMGDDEIESLKGEMNAILDYVGQVKTVAEKTGVIPSKQGEVNVFREDENPNESGAWSKDLIAEFPQREGDYLKVKKIL